MGFSRQEYWSGVPLPSTFKVYRCPSNAQSQLQDFNLLHLSLPERFPLIYFGFLYLPVSLVCNFYPDTKRGGVATYLGSLVQLCCWGGALQTNTTCICTECVHWMDHSGFATAQGSVYFLDPHCSGSRVLYKGTIPSGPCALCTFQV